MESIPNELRCLLMTTELSTKSGVGVEPQVHGRKTTRLKGQPWSAGCVRRGNPYHDQWHDQ
jgi:hypothetical protein